MRMMSYGSKVRRYIYINGVGGEKRREREEIK